MTEATITKLDTRELWEQFGADPLAYYQRVVADMQRRGIEDRPTVSRVLEHVSPSEKDELDAFSRLLRAAGIRTRSDASAGYWASPAAEFFERGPANRALYTEFFARKWREVAFASPQQRAVLLSSEGTPGSWERPYTDAAMARWDERIEPAIPLSELVAMTTPISGQDYRSFYLTYDAEQLRKFRVGESAEIPIATIAGSEHIIRLAKYGRGLKATYEELRRMRVDKLARFIQMASVQSEVDKVAAAIGVLVNGDGNANTAATNYDINGDFGETAGSLSLSGWLQFKMKFVQPYTLTHALMNEDVALELALLDVGSTNSGVLVYNAGGLAGGITPINRTADNVRYGWTAEAPANKIVGFDRRFALEHVVEIGGQIDEMERFITNQTQVMTMTEVDGFAILDANASKTLDIST